LPFLETKFKNDSVFFFLDDPHPFHPPVIKREDAFNIPLPESITISVKAEKGIFHVYSLDEKKQWIPADYPVVDRNQFIDDYTLLSTMITDGPLKSFCYRRLQYIK
jgi:AMP deaminase